ncbi:MAG: hypothetical protein GY720_15050 [bacterium]|nr:hypothetical protein [bacterium]
MINDATVRRALLVMGALGALWAVLAVARDGVTYHLAPLIVAAIPAGFVGLDDSRRVADLPRLAIIGAASALGISLLLTVIGRMDGPSLLPFGGAAAESVIFSVGGALAGWFVARVQSQSEGKH